jgi:hypothetical protein
MGMKNCVRLCPREQTFVTGSEQTQLLVDCRAHVGQCRKRSPLVLHWVSDFTILRPAVSRFYAHESTEWDSGPTFPEAVDHITEGRVHVARRSRMGPPQTEWESESAGRPEHEVSRVSFAKGPFRSET